MKTSLGTELSKLADAIAGLFGSLMFVLCMAVAGAALVVYWAMALPWIAWRKFQDTSRTNDSRRHDTSSRF